MATILIKPPQTTASMAAILISLMGSELAGKTLGVIGMGRRGKIPG